MLKGCFKATSIRKFRSQVEITENREMAPFEAAENTYSTKEEVNNAIVTKFSEQLNDKPFFLFEEEKDDILWNALVHVAKQAKVTFLDCTVAS